MSAFSLRSVLDKMDNTDSDYRFMATSDLLAQLSNTSLRADYDTQKRLCRAILKLLKDSNSEVQGMAMRCIPKLALFVDIQNATYVVEKLLDYILDSSNANARSSASDNVGVKAMRDVSSLALKAIVTDVDPSGHKAASLAPTVVPRLVKTVSVTRAVGPDTDVLIEALELLYEVLTRMGCLVVDMHPAMSNAFFTQLSSPNPLVRKRAISCLGALGAVCDSGLFRNIVDKILTDLQNPQSQETIRTCVQAIRALSKTSGHRLGIHLHTLAPILFDLATLEKHGEDDELRENCLQALESFCLRCRREMGAFAETLAKCVVQLAKYDPNYIVEDGEEDEDEAEGDMAEEEDMDDDFDDDDYSDDDDSSWKVRRAAVKCIHAAITSQLFPPEQLCSEFGPFLVSRFREREEQVKLDVFTAFTDLLRLCSTHVRGSLVSAKGVSMDMDSHDVMAVDAEEGDHSVMEPLMSRSPQIIRNIKKELGSRSVKTRIKAMTVTRELVSAMVSIGTPLVAKIISEVQQGLGDTATAMKTESLLFLRGVVKGGGVVAIQDHVQALVPRVLSAADDRYYKVTAECLRFCSAALLAFGAASADVRTKLAPLAPAIHDSAKRRATAQDQDSEVKEAALHCLGGSVSCFGPSLGPERLSEISAVLNDRLGNEVTRLATVRAMHLIAVSESADVLLPVMNEVATTLSSFLRKNNQTLRTASLELLSVAPTLPSQNDTELVANISELVSDGDLRLASLALKLSNKLAKSRGGSIVSQIAASNSIYARALDLSTSPLLQGRAVASLLGFFRSLAEVNADPLTIQRMLDDLKERTSTVAYNITASASHSSSLYCIAKCVVVVCDAAEPNLRAQIARQIVNDVTSEDFKSRIFTLACLGEFGRSSLLAREGDEKDLVRGAILSALDAAQEEVKTAAALSLGGLASADGASGIPALVSLIKERPAQRYLLLLSLKEAIASSSKENVSPFVSLLVPVLLEQPTIATNGHPTHAETGAEERNRASEAESVRTATAECLGLLTQSSPDVMKSLTAGTTSESANIRAVVAAAVKFAVSTNPNSGSSLFASLRSSLGVFIKLIGDQDVTVAKNAVQALNAIAKSRPGLLASHLPNALPLIYARTPKDKGLVRVVDLGPFKHEEDYGLDLRKSAFDCIRTLISGSLSPSITITTMLEHVIVGLRDQSDVRAIAQLILAIAASTDAAPQMVTIMDPIVRALDETLSEKVKENAVRQEAERHDDSIRGALRAIRMMDAVPEISTNRSFQTLMANVVRTRFVDKYESIGKSEVELLTFGGVPGMDGTALHGTEDVVMAD